MPVPTSITDLSTSEATNSPPGTESAKGNVDNYLRAGFSFTRQLYDGIRSGSYVWLGTATGTADAITASVSPAITAYAAGQTFRFISSGANTGPATINLNALGAKAITKKGATALVAGDIPAGAVCEVIYDGTQFQLIGLGLVSTSGNETINGLKSFQDGILVRTGGADRIKVNTDGGVNLHGPAFSVHKNGTNQSLASATATLVTFSTKLFDTASAFDAVNSRFNPKVAGYYQFNAAVNVATVVPVVMGIGYVELRKNGASAARGYQENGNNADVKGMVASGLIYLNGTTDYVDLVAYAATSDGTASTISGSSVTTRLDGYLVRAE